MNSVYWSSSYCDDYFKPDSRGCCQCENPGPLPGRKQIAWLEQELDLAKRENKRVWLVMHVPPGLDSYAEQKAGGKCLTASMWTPEFTTRYLEIIEKYESVLQVGFAGHTHMDDFRVTMHEGRPLLVHKLVPAVSPIFKNRPAFQIFQWDSARRVVQNWQTYQFDPVAQPKVGVSAWSEEYDARESYALEEMTAASVATLIETATQPTGTAFCAGLCPVLLGECLGIGGEGFARLFQCGTQSTLRRFCSSPGRTEARNDGTTWTAGTDAPSQKSVRHLALTT
ncbi:MAG: hypothetical protein VX470_07305 [Planctomycetota bacterium]|nr:hypothetical protein [Planctomycetota bacterium]